MVRPSKVFVVVILACFASLAWVVPASADWQVGARLGIQVSNVEGDISGTSGYPSFLTGFVASYERSENLAIDIELVGVERGFEQDGIEFTARWLELPALVRVSVPTSESLAWSAYVGPYVAAKLETTRANEFALRPDPLKSYDVGAQLGGGVSIRLTNVTLGIEGRVTRALTSIGEGGQSIYHQGFSLLIGFLT